MTSPVHRSANIGGGLADAVDDAKRKALRTRLTIGPILVAVVFAFYWLDTSWGRGKISAVVLKPETNIQ